MGRPSLVLDHRGPACTLSRPPGRSRGRRRRRHSPAAAVARSRARAVAEPWTEDEPGRAVETRMSVGWIRGPNANQGRAPNTGLGAGLAHGTQATGSRPSRSSLNWWPGPPFWRPAYAVRRRETGRDVPGPGGRRLRGVRAAAKDARLEVDLEDEEAATSTCSACWPPRRSGAADLAPNGSGPVDGHHNGSAPAAPSGHRRASAENVSKYLREKSYPTRHLVRLGFIFTGGADGPPLPSSPAGLRSSS